MASAAAGVAAPGEQVLRAWTDSEAAYTSESSKYFMAGFVTGEPATGPERVLDEAAMERLKAMTETMTDARQAYYEYVTSND